MIDLIVEQLMKDEENLRWGAKHKKVKRKKKLAGDTDTNEIMEHFMSY